MFNAIGAHIYAGGFTVGMKEHFNVLAHLEHAAYGDEVVKLNYPDLPIYDGGPSNWPKKWPRGSEWPRFLYANPPCAIWSGASAGRATHWTDDPRLQFHHDIFRYALDDIGVDVLAIESVPPSWTKGRSHIDSLIEQADTRGYSSTVVMHNAKYLGVPQQRSRIFYVFHKVEFIWDHPDFGTPMTVRQAFKKHKPNPKRGYSTKLPEKHEFFAKHAAPGEGLARVYNRLYPNPPRNARGQISGRPSFLDVRLPWDRPANVLIAGKPIHPEELRFLSQEEAAVICGYPKSYKWPAKDFNTITGYMSRGVMPPVGSWLGENVARALERGQRLNRPTAAVLDCAHPPGAYYTI